MGGYDLRFTWGEVIIIVVIFLIWIISKIN